MYSDDKKLTDVINFGALWLQTNELDDTSGFLTLITSEPHRFYNL